MDSCLRCRRRPDFGGSLSLRRLFSSSNSRFPAFLLLRTGGVRQDGNSSMTREQTGEKLPKVARLPLSSPLFLPSLAFDDFANASVRLTGALRSSLTLLERSGAASRCV